MSHTISFDAVRRNYGNTDYVPPFYIPVIMEHFFPTSSVTIIYSDIHKVYRISLYDMMMNMTNATKAIVNWEFNRPPDENRCIEIARHIYNHLDSPVDTLFCLAYDNRLNAFQIIDGVHRLTALTHVFRENSKQMSSEEAQVSEFGGNYSAGKWFHSTELLVNIRFNTSNGVLNDVFRTLNKSIPVSELYMVDHANEKRECIKQIVKEWTTKYKRNFTSSPNPSCGNTNVSKFEELLLRLYDKHRIRFTNPDKLKMILNTWNQYVAQNIPKHVSAAARTRCLETGCFLFMWKTEMLELMISNNANPLSN